MTDSPPSPLARLIAQWREKAKVMRCNADGTVVESLIAQRSDAFKEAADELEAALRDSESAQRVSVDDMLDIYVPGNWRCLKCGYGLSSQTMFVGGPDAGSIGSTREQVMALSGECCPNDGEPMVRVTWRERADENQKWGLSLMEEIIAATGAEHLPGAFDVMRSMARFRTLAREEAFNKHAHYCLDVEKRGHIQGMNDSEWGFSTCPHPDCVLVREPQP